ncbi:hypothetical protein F5X98DRAFT_337118 [Xylaria grammica]|nr:hypothetical protein F5X98DRAFT_337118 [Xylaria grammica]
MSRCPLECGADINFIIHYDGRTPWARATIIATLTSAYFRKTSSRPQWVPILRLSLEYGAPQVRNCAEWFVNACLLFLGRHGIAEERLATVLGCVAVRREELGLGYLSAGKTSRSSRGRIVIHILNLVFAA